MSPVFDKYMDDRLRLSPNTSLSRRLEAITRVGVYGAVSSSKRLLRLCLLGVEPLLSLTRVLRLEPGAELTTPGLSSFRNLFVTPTNSRGGKWTWGVAGAVGLRCM